MYIFDKKLGKSKQKVFSIVISYIWEFLVISMICYIFFMTNTISHIKH